jgi:regulator of protease activity HflC (stomatin/prohibitin superfamily)
MFFIGILIGLLLTMLWKLKDCFFKVDEGYVALVTRFGAVHRASDRQLKLYQSGLHTKWSFEEIHLVSLREHLVALGESQGAEPMMLNDGTVVRIEAKLRYAPLTSELEHYVFGLQHRKEHVQSLFSSLLRNEIANLKAPMSDESAGGLIRVEEVSGSFSVLRRERQTLNQRIADFAAKHLGKGYGISFEGVDIVDLKPPEELAQSLNAVMSARTEADSIRFRAESDSAQRTMTAEQGVAIAKANAAAVEIEIETLGRHLKTLEQSGVLQAYVQRREAEIMSDARTVYVNEVRANGSRR